MLGPLRVNDLSTINNNFKFIMYADDTPIYFNKENFPKINLANHITTELDNIYIWLKHNKLSLNVEKTKCMTFHASQKNIQVSRYIIR